MPTTAWLKVRRWPGFDAPRSARQLLNVPSAETARLRLEQEYAALNEEGEVTGSSGAVHSMLTPPPSQKGVAQAAVQPAPPTAINSRPVPTGNPNAVDITAHFTQACAGNALDSFLLLARLSCTWLHVPCSSTVFQCREKFWKLLVCLAGHLVVILTSCSAQHRPTCER